MRRLAIFDIDGTLLNTLGDLNACMNEFLLSHSLPSITSEDTKRFVGYGAKAYVMKAAGINEGKLLDKYTEEYLSVLNSCENSKTVLYDGLDKVLKRLKNEGVTLAILSNKPQKAVDICYEKMLKGYGFSYVLGEREGIKRKPDRESVDLILNSLYFTCEESVFIGDTEVDLQTAVNSRMKCINVLWGFRSQEQLISAGAYDFASTAEELYDKIMKI